eukprot:scaffold48_cov311-Pinguiococcus_pyrenoidosus.AAC.301
MQYFASDAYRGDASQDMPFLLRWSAACKDEAVCLDPSCAEVVQDASVCPFDDLLAWTDLAVLLALCVGMIIKSWHQAKQVEQLDESEQTAQDYSIVVHDPSPDCTDPKKYEEFFRERFGPVRFVTVARRNGRLIKALALRRHCRDRAQNLSEQSKAHQERVGAPWWQRPLQLLGFHRDARYWTAYGDQLSEQIDELLREETVHEPCKIFVSFETEESQRECLQAMTDGLLNVVLDEDVTSCVTGHQVGDEYLWTNSDGSKNRLFVEEAPEANDVIWANLEVSLHERLLDLVVGFGLCAALLIGVFFSILALSRNEESFSVGLFISGANSFLPIFLKAINEQERHLTEGSKQSSLLLKLVVSRWMTTALIQNIITPVADTVAPDTVARIRDILIADALASPVIRLLDAPGRFERLILSQFASTQNEMDAHFAGSQWSLAERYTDMTKSIFVAMFYMTVFPMGVWITSLAMVSNFWVDKYCILRVWAPKPALGGRITQLNRTYIALALFVHFMTALHTYAAWPFDGFQATETPIEVDAADDTNREVTYRRVDIPDHKTSAKWFLLSDEDFMTEEQREVVDVFNVMTLLFFILFLIIYFGDEAVLSVKALLRGNYKPVGQSQGIPHSTLKGDQAIDAYTPVVDVEGYKYPLLVCELSFPPDHLPFTVPEGDLEELSLWADVCDPQRPRGSARHKDCFSVVAHFDLPPQVTQV